MHDRVDIRKYSPDLHGTKKVCHLGIKAKTTHVQRVMAINFHDINIRGLTFQNLFQRFIHHLGKT